MCANVNKNIYILFTSKKSLQVKALLCVVLSAYSNVHNVFCTREAPEMQVALISAMASNPARRCVAGSSPDPDEL